VRLAILSGFVLVSGLGMPVRRWRVGREYEEWCRCYWRVWREFVVGLGPHLTSDGLLLAISDLRSEPGALWEGLQITCRRPRSGG
jgi:hypothetical protein